jgi:hypothetical protein
MNCAFLGIYPLGEVIKKCKLPFSVNSVVSN